MTTLPLSSQIDNTLSGLSSNLPPTERMLRIADLKGAIKLLQRMLDEDIAMLGNEINLGLLEEYEVDGSIVYAGVRCTPVATKRWEYDQNTKDAIKQLQERAQYDCTAIQKITTSFRFTS